MMSEPVEPLGDAQLSSTVADRALASATRAARGRPPGSVALLAAAIELVEDEDLIDLLGAMLLNAGDLIDALERIAPEEDVGAEEVVRRARERFGDDPDASALIVAAALEQSPPLARELSELSLTPRELAAQVAEWRVRREGASPGNLTLSALAVFTSIVTSVLLVTHVVQSGSWWQLVFLVGVWSGYPKEGPAVGVGVAALLLALVSPPVAVAQLVGVVVEIIHAKVERDAVWARTGVRISLREQRYVVVRLLTRRARRGQMGRQLLRLHLPTPGFLR